MKVLVARYQHTVSLTLMCSDINRRHAVIPFVLPAGFDDDLGDTFATFLAELDPQTIWFDGL